eukprot:15483887-Alexandrium_andersonii.AAC.1
MEASAYRACADAWYPRASGLVMRRGRMERALGWYYLELRSQTAASSSIPLAGAPAAWDIAADPATSSDRT